jgi:CO/xanthine dehydrogenase FAD-binding subunit
MIVEYHRPDTIQAAFQLLDRATPVTVPLGGGTVLNKPSPDPVAVVDLQALGFNKFEHQGDYLKIGATVTLQQMLGIKVLPPALKTAIRHEATYNTRQIATVAGTLVAAGGRSPLATAMLALGTQVVILPGEELANLGDILPFRGLKLKGRLISQVNVPVNLKLAYEYVARTPMDLPIVCVGVAQWPSGRTRVALGGYGGSPILAMDGPEPTGAEIAARDVYRQAHDQWASADYRSDIAGILTKRCLTG